MEHRAEENLGGVSGEPDPRLLYANERTFLAWIRTSLALIATGLGIVELLPNFSTAHGRKVVGIPLIALGVVVATVALRNWRANDRAMRAGEALRLPRLAVLTAVVVAIVALLAAVLAIAGSSG